LLSMTEKTARAIACIIIASTGGQGRQDASTSHEVLVALKGAFRNMRLHRPPDLKPSLDTFPDQIDAFMIRCPGRYLADDPPVKSKLESNILMTCRGNVACRKTHTSLRQGLACGSSSSSNQNVLNMVMPLLQALMHRNGTGRDMHLQMLTPPTRRQKEVGALMDITPSDKAEGAGVSPLPLALPAPPRKGTELALEDEASDGDDVDATRDISNSTSIVKAVSVTDAAAKVRMALLSKHGAATARAKAKAKAKLEGEPKAVAKSKTVAKAKAKAKGAAKAKVKPSDGLKKVPGKFPKLGCAKCRGAAGGCSQCKRASFSGRRFQRVKP